MTEGRCTSTHCRKAGRLFSLFARLQLFAERDLTRRRLMARARFASARWYSRMLSFCSSASFAAAAAITALCIRLRNRENQKKDGADKPNRYEQEEKSQ